ncbi:hypothetical protein [Rhizobium viscosum]|nr:hypothetical protein [Rhizobium viscosum]
MRDPRMTLPEKPALARRRNSFYIRRPCKLAADPAGTQEIRHIPT